MIRSPTFELLREKKELHVVYPENGHRFEISLRDWEGCLWFVRVYPRHPRPSDKNQAYVGAHRMISRATLDDWLSRLKLTAAPKIKK
jgi:hypothetical protein